MLKRDEGFRSKPYLDTVGKLTIGWGRNIEDNGISREEAELMLGNDITEVIKQCTEEFEWYARLNEARKIVILNMVFNLGIGNFKKFKKTIAYIECENYEQAAIEMLDSLWSKQVGSRAVRLSKIMQQGSQNK